MRAAIARGYAETITAAARVLSACSNDDLSGIIGSYSMRVDGKLRCKPGLMQPENMITMAQHLVLHGVLGDQPQVTGDKKGEYSSRFDARSWVYLAVAHLGISEAEAWGMTMTGLRAALAAKYPEKEKSKVPTEAEYDASVDMADALIQADASVTH